MRSKVVKWGNSLGLRIPRTFAEEIRVSDGTAVDLAMVDGCLVVRPAPQGEWSLDELLAGVTPANIHAEIGTGGATGGEAW